MVNRGQGFGPIQCDCGGQLCRYCAPKPTLAQEQKHARMLVGMEQMLIYVAGPYTPREQDLHGAAWEANRNVNRAMQMGWKVMEKGQTTVMPHLIHFFQIFAPKPMSYDWFMAWEEQQLKRCDALFRFERSPGADKEYEIARAAGLLLFDSLEEVPTCRT